MSRLLLDPAPTFAAEVGIPVPGLPNAPVRITFKHRSRSEMQQWLDALAELADADVVLGEVAGWDLADAFTPENVRRLCENYIGAARAIHEKYVHELVRARLGN